MLLKKLSCTKERLEYWLLLGRLEVKASSATNGFQVSVRRGSFAADAKGQAVSDRVYKLQPQKFSIESTMLYDEADNKYLSKKATIKIREMDKHGKQVKTVCKFELELADLFNTPEQYFALEYDFEYNGQPGKLYFDVEFKSSHSKNMDKVGTNGLIKKASDHTADTQASSVKPIQLSPSRFFSEQSQGFPTEGTDIFRQDALHEQLEQKNMSLKMLQKQNDLMRRQMERLLLEQRVTQKHTIDYQGVNEKTKALRLKLEQKEGQLDMAIDKNARLAQRLQKAQQKTRQQHRHIRQLSEDLQSAKCKMASLLQECLEKGDNDLITLVQKHYG